MPVTAQPPSYDSRRITERVVFSVRTPDNKRVMRVSPALLQEYLDEGWLLMNPAEGQSPDGTWEDE